MANTDGDSHDFVALLSSPNRDYLIRNTADQVKIESLKGKKLGLYFSASWCGPCQQFTPALVEVYSALAPKGDLEIVFLSADEDDESFKEYFSKMPWLAIPFADSDVRERLNDVFKVEGIPSLVILDENGKVVTESGAEIVQDYGVQCYPFTAERIKELKEEEEEARRNQTLKSILVFESRDYVVSSDGKKIPISELEGKTLGVYFSMFSYQACLDFTSTLAEVYEKLKLSGENFEVVFVSLDDDKETFQKSLGNMPWLALPFSEKFSQKLVRYFELSTAPTLVIIGPDGKTLHSNVVETIEEHGLGAYPFTPEKFSELAEIEKAREAAQTLESVLVSGEQNFVIGKDGAKILVSDLVGKNILLYFSAHWCPPCRDFMPKLIEAYHKTKAKDNAFEIIFISSDSDQASFDDFFSEMPWLALPFEDMRMESLSRKFKVNSIPMLVALGPTGQTIIKDARSLITLFGADAFPFTEEHLKNMEAKYEATAKNFDLHPKCALKENKETKDGEPVMKEGWVCDGEVCQKA